MKRGERWTWAFGPVRVTRVGIVRRICVGSLCLVLVNLFPRCLLTHEALA